MKIEVVKRVDVVKRITQETSPEHIATLKISSYKDDEGKVLMYLNCIESNKHSPPYISSSIKYGKICTKIPSTLLSRWININFQNELSTLMDRCSSVEHITNGKYKGWWWRGNAINPVYGLNKVKIRSDGDVTRLVKIDDSIGMQNVINILKLLDINVECEYDVTKGKMKSIKLYRGN